MSAVSDYLVSLTQQLDFNWGEERFQGDTGRSDVFWKQEEIGAIFGTTLIAIITTTGLK